MWSLAEAITLNPLPEVSIYKFIYIIQSFLSGICGENDGGYAYKSVQTFVQ